MTVKNIEIYGGNLLENLLRVDLKYLYSTLNRFENKYTTKKKLKQFSTIHVGRRPTTYCRTEYFRCWDPIRKR